MCTRPWMRWACGQRPNPVAGAWASPSYGRSCPPRSGWAAPECAPVAFAFGPCRARQALKAIGSWYWAQDGSSSARARPADARVARQSAIAAARAVMASAPQRGAGPTRPLGHELRHRSVNFGVGEGPVARLQDHVDGDRFRALWQTVPLIDVEDADLGDERAFGALRRPDNVAGA